MHRRLNVWLTILGMIWFANIILESDYKIGKGYKFNYHQIIELPKEGEITIGREPKAPKEKGVRLRVPEINKLIKKNKIY